jgi:hypothetical protein
MDDLRELFGAARPDLPPARYSIDDITGTARRIRRRRRAVGGYAGAAVLAVLAVVGVTVVPRVTPSTPVAQAPAASARLVYPFAGFTRGGYRVGAPAVATPGYATAPVLRGTDRIGTLTVYRTGAFAPDRFAHGQDVTVAGHAGMAGTDPAAPTVAWPYADRSWAVLATKTGEPATAAAQAVAGGLTMTPGAPVTAPVRLGYTPPGWQIVAVERGTPVRIMLAPRDLAFTGLTGPVDLSGTLEIAIASHGTPGCAKSVCTVSVPGTGYYAQVRDLGGRLSTGEATVVVKSLGYADPADPATWFPVP